MLAKGTGTLFAGIDNKCKDFLTIILLVKYFRVMLKREEKEKKTPAVCYSSDFLPVSILVTLYLRQGSNTVPFTFFSLAERKGVVTA